MTLLGFEGYFSYFSTFLDPISRKIAYVRYDTLTDEKKIVCLL